MFGVYFRRSNGEDKFLANCADFNTVNEVISYFLKERNFKSYYSRMWVSAPGVLKIDIGSHTEFFIVRGPVDTIIKTLMIKEEC